MKQSFSSLLTFVFILFFLQLNAQVSGVKPELIMLRHNGGSSSPSPVVADNILGTIRWNGLTAINNTITGAAIQSRATQVSPGLLRADMRFSTSGNERAIITSDGLFGIGTMNPQYHLHVVGNTHTSGRFYGRIHFDVGAPTNLPSTYNDEAYFERKSRAELGLAANTYVNGGILSLAPGGNSLDRQLFTGGSDGLWTRSQDPAGTDSWAAWQKILTSEDINGNVGRVARFTGSTIGAPSSSLGNSQLFDDGTDVGIGTTTPDAAYLLTVGGDTRIDGDTRTNGNANVTGATTTNSLTVNTNATVTGSTTTSALSVNNNATVSGATRLIGKVAIGPDPMATDGIHSLYVSGSAIAEEVVVKLKANWPDYVFDKAYSLPSLSAVDRYVRDEKHLPGVPSANELSQNGLEVGAMQHIQMEKIEELFLHLIALEKRVNALEAENKDLKNKVEQEEKR